MNSLESLNPARVGVSFSQKDFEMIYDSYYWKNNLGKLATKLRKYSNRWNPGETLLAHFEQTIMLGFYSVRKLVESHKLSENIIGQQIELTAYPWAGNTNVTLRNWEEINELYDLRPTTVCRDLVFLCNQIIHSYVFLPILEEDGHGISGILFSSDRHRHQFLYQLDLERVIRLYRQIAKDDPNHFSWTFNPERQDYDYRLWTDTSNLNEIAP